MSIVLGDQKRLYLETFPVDRLESGFGRFWNGANVRFALRPLTATDFALRKPLKSEPKNPIVLLLEELQLCLVTPHQVDCG